MTFAASANAAPAAAPQKPAPGAPVPMPKILVINREALLRASKVGQSIGLQVQAYTQQAEKDLKGQGDALRAEGQSLQQQIAILAPDVKAKKIADFQAKERALQMKIQQRQTLIQGGVLKARGQIEQALAPIIQGIMAERGANLLLDRAAVVFGTADMDVTRVAIQRLDQKLPTVKVELVAPPVGTMLPQQGQQ
ncbi:MAG TPA: OmpH family outer membrane protein [Rhizomicrobium sp.]|nr:OmpH family outer membrane protein [Rhizomicrobium sp.]